MKSMFSLFRGISLISMLMILISAPINGLYAQQTQLSKVIMPSPDVLAFQKYGEIPVSTYTGIPNISIPLYTIKSHDITVPITLSYHASGIKVNENASRVGLGWVMNAGGSISRNVIGYDDFSMGHYLNGQTTRADAPDLNGGKGFAFTFMDFWNHGPDIAYKPCIIPIFNKNPGPGQQTLQNTDYGPYLDKALSSAMVDFQPDQFYYNVGGLSGKFVLKRNREAILQNQERIKINCLNNDGTSWQITGLDGTTYTFDKIEDNYPNGEIGNKIKTAWHLTNITSPRGNKVNFFYTELPGSLQPSSTFSETKEMMRTALAQPNQPNPGTAKQERHDPVFGNIYTLQVLSYIDYDNGRVVFNYSNDREDLSGEKRLESISIFDKDLQGNVNALPVKKEIFDYTYFVSGNTTNTFPSSTGGNPLKRLKLISVVENGYYQGKIVPGSPYLFSYNETGVNNQLPAKTSFAIDHWGYYNGRLQNTSFIPTYSAFSGTTINNVNVGPPGPEREPDTSYVKAFSLNKIQYPTGGSTDFVFEANDFDDVKSISNDNSKYARQTALVQQTANFTYYNDTQTYIGSQVLDMSNEYKDVNNNIVPGKVNCAFRLSGAQGTINSLPQNQMYIRVRDSAGTEVLYVDPANLPFNPVTSPASGAYVTYSPGSSVITVNNIPLALSPGVYTWTAFCGTGNYGKYVMDVHSIFTWTAQVNYDLSNSNTTSANAYLAGGGIRIKKIIDHDGLSPANDKIKKYLYHYTAIGADNLLHEYSYGKRMSKRSMFSGSHLMKIIQHNLRVAASLNPLLLYI